MRLEWGSRSATTASLHSLPSTATVLVTATGSRSEEGLLGVASQDSQAPQSPLCQPPQLCLSTQQLPLMTPDLTPPVTRGQLSRDTELASRSTFRVSTGSGLEVGFQPPLPPQHWPPPPLLRPLPTEPLLHPAMERPPTAMVNLQPLPTLHPTVMLDTAILFLPTHLSTQ